MDLTDDIKAAPHGLEVLDRFEAVGEFERPRKEPAPGSKGALIAGWIATHFFGGILNPQSSTYL